jgi:hypothetical protein
LIGDLAGVSATIIVASALMLATIRSVSAAGVRR